MNEEIFLKELLICRELYQRDNGKCNWGECAHCGVIPMLYKLHKGETYESEEKVKELRQTIFKSL